MRLPPRPAALPRALSLAVLLAAAACSDAPTASRAALPAARHDGAAAATTLRRPTLIPNRVKYRDAGYHPATGRAGSATLFMQALVGRDGKTEMQVATNEWGLREGWSPGAITHLQVKALAPDGKLLATRTHGSELPGGGVATLTYGGMTRGTQLQVQGTVRGIDANRTDVPVVTGTVRLRPNLAVRDVVAPERVREGSAVWISATVAETNGDLGAWSACQLYVDGTPRDWAQGIWVDAGDAVTCLFYTDFSGGGRHQVEVRLGYSSPRDDDPRDNAASTQVEVEGSTELFYFASVSDFRSDQHVLTRSLWSTSDSLGNSSGLETQDESRSSQAQRQVAFYGWTFRAMSALPRVEIEEESAGASVFSAAYHVEPIWVDYGWTCGEGQDGATGVFLAFCSSAWGGTNVQYARWSTRVTYHSSNYVRFWDSLTGEDLVYHYNYDQESGDGLPLTPLGGDFTIRVRLVADGTQFSAAAAFPLQTEELRFDSPLSCWTESYPYWPGSTGEYCSLYEESRKTVSGSVFRL